MYSRWYRLVALCGALVGLSKQHIGRVGPRYCELVTPGESPEPASPQGALIRCTSYGKPTLASLTPAKTAKLPTSPHPGLSSPFNWVGSVVSQQVSAVRDSRPYVSVVRCGEWVGGGGGAVRRAPLGLAADVRAALDSPFVIGV